MCSGCSGDPESGNPYEHNHVCPECQNEYVCTDPNCECHHLRVCPECSAAFYKEREGKEPNHV